MRKNSSAPSPQNGANNGVSSRETAENISKGLADLIIATDEYSDADVLMDAVHVVQSDSPRERDFFNF